MADLSGNCRTFWLFFHPLNVALFERVSDTFIWIQLNFKLDCYCPVLVSSTTLASHRLLSSSLQGEEGWRSGESTHLPPMWPGFKSWTQRHMWVELVVGSRPCSEGFFFGYSSFPLSSKTNISKFQFDLDTVDKKPPCGCATANSHLFI